MNDGMIYILQLSALISSPIWISVAVFEISFKVLDLIERMKGE